MCWTCRDYIAVTTFCEQFKELYTVLKDLKPNLEENKHMHNLATKN